MTLCIIVALKAEAQPLISHWHLKQRPSKGPFPLYEGEGIQLLLSGMGRVRAAAATAYCAGLCQAAGKKSAYLNVGLAGHRFLELGTPVCVHKWIEEASQTPFFPSFPFPPPCQTEACTTVEREERLYEAKSLYDMEGSGFFMVASKFAPIELVHSLKVVSDNALSPPSLEKRRSLPALIEKAMGQIGELALALRRLVKELPKEEPPLFDILTKARHFTCSETEQLKRLLHKNCALTSPKALLQLLQNHVETKSLSL